ncbi:hypothetical protein RB653_008405 [Dictyostelium firmibasis]|uniref:Peptide deformylase n=1 Tax=Dictyostelium firmibasis TaxID=79012 RepID=A0AAN7TR02_9MYCE
MEAVNISKNIIKIGNKLLREKAVAWGKDEFKDTKGIEKILDTLSTEMRSSSGTGIAAPQIGINKQLFLFELKSQQGMNFPNFPLTAFFNPKIQLIDQDVTKPSRRTITNINKFLHSSEKLLNLSQYKTKPQTEESTLPTNPNSNNTITMLESCLSIPNIFAHVQRSRRCIITFLDITGRERIIEADGIIAACLQHEYDHLIGKIFIDRIDKNELIDKLIFTTELSKDHLTEIYNLSGDFQITK